MNEKSTLAHALLAERIAKCVTDAEALCVSDHADVLVQATSDLRRALSAVRDRAAAIKIRAPDPRNHRGTPSDVLSDIHARRIRYRRLRKARGLAGLFGGRG